MYELILTQNAERDLQRLDGRIRRQIHDKLERLRENCDICSHKALTAKYKGHFRLASGDYRAIYTFNKQTKTIVVSRIGHRSSVYK
ncbi:type II toxin-antitoxin system RelE/ParE family toxin [Candidatus Poribacteria bacterium]|nr:type II toxin-antitoxin system RelE/ParE family toxin [Candidatus Poribacteria bacterium]MYI94777.1 type II toxin-antitoxin system RelE/ParE family toxin [Candidatus Poribacteria bacterium]